MQRIWHTRVLLHSACNMHVLCGIFTYISLAKDSSLPEAVQNWLQSAWIMRSYWDPAALKWTKSSIRTTLATQILYEQIISGLSILWFHQVVLEATRYFFKQFPLPPILIVTVFLLAVYFHGTNFLYNWPLSTYFQLSKRRFSQMVIFIILFYCTALYVCVCTVLDVCSYVLLVM